MTGRVELIPVTIAGAFTCGVLLGLAGALRVPLAKRLALPEARSRLLPWMLSLALMPAVVASGFAADAWGVEWLLVGGSLLAAPAVAGLALVQRVPAALGVLGLMGTAAAALGVASNLLMPAAFFPGKPIVALNLGNVFFGLGLLAAPALTDVLLERAGFRRSIGLLALFCLAPALTAALTVSQAYPPPAVEVLTAPRTDALLLGAAGVAFLLYGPLETLIAGWAVPYLTALGCSPRRAVWLLTGFWLALVAARLLTALLWQPGKLHPGLEATFLAVLAVLSAVALGNLAAMTNRRGAAWCLLLAGLCLGPIFPTLLGLVFERYPADRGAVFGGMFALSALGSVVLLPLLDWYARRASIQKAMRLPMFLALALAVATLIPVLLLTSK